MSPSYSVFKLLKICVHFPRIIPAASLSVSSCALKSLRHIRSRPFKISSHFLRCLPIPPIPPIFSDTSLYFPPLFSLLVFHYPFYFPRFILSPMVLAVGISYPFHFGCTPNDRFSLSLPVLFDLRVSGADSISLDRISTPVSLHTA
jgi:hypothetical protein